jgi:RNA polymerase sigma-70 factor (ECF subfamily)
VERLDLGGYYLFHAIRADLLRRLGRDADAALAYQAAIAGTSNAAELAHLAAAKHRVEPEAPRCRGAGEADRHGRRS